MHYQRWKDYVQWAKDNGMDVCHITLSLGRLHEMNRGGI
jgi:hypothetical protein